jgi:hypothetical protein
VLGRTTTAMLLAAALSACAPADRPQVAPPAKPAVGTVTEDVLMMRPVQVPSSPAPLVEVQLGNVHAIIPKGWDARQLPSQFAQEGFEASPHIAEWDQGANAVSGIEAFYVDVNKVGIPSDYYYLAARSVSFGGLSNGRECRPSNLDVVANHPPDFTGRHDSPSDFVASARGRCVGANGRATHWAYVVAAPGFGPVRQLGIPTSGLYVVMVQIAGPHADARLDEMLSMARFGDATVPQLVRAAGQEQPH